jgi:hypothetical protein
MPYQPIALGNDSAHLQPELVDSLGVSPRSGTLVFDLYAPQFYRQQINVFRGMSIHCLLQTQCAPARGQLKRNVILKEASSTIADNFLFIADSGIHRKGEPIFATGVPVAVWDEPIADERAPACFR